MNGRYLRWHGRGVAPEREYVLRAGPLEARVVGLDLRDVRLGEVNVAQRVYVGVRDAAWNTLPATVERYEVLDGGDNFRVEFVARHVLDDIDYTWTGTYEGTAEGEIICRMDGIANRAFTHAKIGFNLHHALSSYKGCPYVARTPDGEITGEIPERIDPQLVRDGTLTAIFPYFDQLEVELEGGVDARFVFEGDYFEMQDHRNWSDANYKTYGTPLEFGFPMDVDEGARFEQRITITASGEHAGQARDEAAPITLEVGQPLGRQLPPLGFGMASHGQYLSERERTLLRATAPSHVRADLILSDEAHAKELERAAQTATDLGCGLELALFITENAAEEFEEFASRAAALPAPIHRILVFQHAEGFSEMRGSTPPELVELAAEKLRPAISDAPVVGGTNQFFTELNRDRPDPDPMDGVAFSLNPQVHAGDERSIVENLGSKVDIIESANALYPGLGVFVTPVTLIGRNGPFPAGPPDPDGLPGAVDPRQASLVGAVWTLGSVKGLAEGGADGVTYYETTGWRGLMETDAGNPMQELFPASAGQVYPLYHVFADLAELRDLELVEAASADPTIVVGIAARSAEGDRLLLGNVTAEVQRVTVSGLEADSVRARTLDDANADLAMDSPDRFRSDEPAVLPVDDGVLHLVLAPYAYMRLDAQSVR